MLQFTRFQSVSGGMEAPPTPAALEQVQSCGEQRGGRHLLHERRKIKMSDVEHQRVFVQEKVKVWNWGERNDAALLQ